MSHKQTKAAAIASKAANYNLTDLLNQFVVEYTPTHMRRMLSQAYYAMVDAIIDSGVTTNSDSDTLYALRSIIEAVDQMEDPGERLVTIIPA